MFLILWKAFPTQEFIIEIILCIWSIWFHKSPAATEFWINFLEAKAHSNIYDHHDWQSI